MFHLQSCLSWLEVKTKVYIYYLELLLINCIQLKETFKAFNELFLVSMGLHHLSINTTSKLQQSTLSDPGQGNW